MGSMPRLSTPVSSAKVAIGLGLGLTLGACSMSFPIPGFVDKSTTGTVAGKPRPILSSALDREDLRRADAALAVALDPQGNGTNVAWANPESGAGGAFVALAPPFPDHDGICRAFGGNILAPAQTKRRIRGSACRTAGGDWSIAELDEQK